MPEKLKELLDKKGVTAYRLAKDTGIGKATISQWLNGVCNPSVEKCLILANYFDVTLDELLGGDLE